MPDDGDGVVVHGLQFPVERRESLRVVEEQCEELGLDLGTVLVYGGWVWLQLMPDKGRPDEWYKTALRHSGSLSIALRTFAEIAKPGDD